MTETVFGYLILISIDFYNFISLFSPQFQFGLRSYINLSRQCLTIFPNTFRFVKNTPLCIIFSALLLAFGNVVKHGQEDLCFNLILIIYVTLFIHNISTMILQFMKFIQLDTNNVIAKEKSYCKLHLFITVMNKIPVKLSP